ncbi:uncharacterized protein LOC142560103 isoform X2 [Dermacentor variabilis]|uniref:uncharacterized protein LOC142560103 isoform X2 n=1 Tax=Dermacentor variabilis TaxID=34621 RepID=UPI003F5B8014
MEPGTKIVLGRLHCSAAGSHPCVCRETPAPLLLLAESRVTVYQHACTKPPTAVRRIKCRKVCCLWHRGNWNHVPCRRHQVSSSPVHPEFLPDFLPSLQTAGVVTEPEPTTAPQCGTSADRG